MRKLTLRSEKQWPNINLQKHFLRLTHDRNYLDYYVAGHLSSL